MFLCDSVCIKFLGLLPHSCHRCAKVALSVALMRALGSDRHRKRLASIDNLG